MVVKHGGQDGWDSRTPIGPHGCRLRKGIMKIVPLFKKGDAEQLQINKE